MALLPDYPAHLPQKSQTVGAGIGRVCIREELADVPQGRRPQQGIRHGMGQYIGVRVAQKALFPGNLHAA